MAGSSELERANFWAVVPAGGAGTRLWPLSRATRPKFLLPLIGDRSLLQETVDRLSPLAPSERTLVICGPAHAAEVGEQLPDLSEQNILVEPVPRGSGPAIALAASLIARRDPNAVMGSFAADHVVTDERAFRTAVRTAMAVAANDDLVTIGLTPTRPETGYGYLECSHETVSHEGSGTAYRALRFVEKPDLATAREYLASGRFYWNASMFVWRVDAFLAELERLRPEMHTALNSAAEAWEAGDRERVEGIWQGLEDISVDHAVMEHAARVATVPAEIGWSDIGDWHGLGEMLPVDERNNCVRADAVQIDATDCVVWSETGRLVALVGQTGTVVVDTPDAVLVVSRDRAQDVKRIVDALKREKRTDLI